MTINQSHHFKVYIIYYRKQNKQQDAIRKETSSTALYANVQNDDHRLVESNVNRVEDRGIYENADLGKSQKSRHKLYNDTPNEEQKLADNGKTGDFLPLKPNDVKGNSVIIFVCKDDWNISSILSFQLVLTDSTRLCAMQ